MKNEQEFKLIDGDFTSDEAKEVLLSLIGYKVQFHNNKVFSDEIRFGEKCEVSLKRIEELNAEREKIKDLIELSEKEGKKVIIKSTISVELVDEKELVS